MSRMTELWKAFFGIHVIVNELLREFFKFRDVDELSDMEFNELFLEAFPRVMVDEEPKHETLKPRIYNPQSSSWEPHRNQNTEHKKGDALKIVSWKLFPSALSLVPDNLVVMLQEIREESLDTILKHEWVQQNFIISDTEPLYDEYDFNDDGEGDMESSQCFSIMMTSRNLPISNCSRVSFFSETNCDALVVDVPVSESEGHGHEVSRQSLRLCTTRLELNPSAPGLRRSELVTVSEILNGKWSQGQKILGGLVGGNLGPLTVSERLIHKDPEIGLMDVWENKTATAKPSRMNDRWKAKADAWTFHPDRKRYEKMLDKFLYTGSIKAFTLDEAQNKTKTMGLFGKDLKIQVGSEEVRVSEHSGLMVGIKVT